MTTQLKEAMTSGVLIEFRNAAGDTVGQAIFTDWRGRPLPALGDRLSVNAFVSASQQRRLAGQVVSRRFEIQQGDDGPCVWVRIVVERSLPRRATGTAFSRN